MIEEQVKSIRVRLRLAMNGVISSSMREKGIRYRLNFGVPLPEIREIARAYSPDPELAAALWKEDIREFKILATLLQPAASFSCEEALAWVKEIPYPEIAEQASRNLFSKMEAADRFAAELFDRTEKAGEEEEKESPYAREVAFLTWAHQLAAGVLLPPTVCDRLRTEALRTLDGSRPAAPWAEKQAAVLALRSYGRLSETKAAEVLSWLADFAASADAEQQEFYKELKFDFEYFR